MSLSTISAVAVTAAAAFFCLGLRELIWRGGRRLSLEGQEIAHRACHSRMSAWLAARHPRMHAFLRARVETRRFTGLTLTLMTAAGAYVAILFGGLTRDVLERDEIVRLDEAINAALDPVRVQPFLDVFLWITVLGAGAVAAAVAVVATGFLWMGGRRPDIAGLWTAFLGAEATTQAGKHLIARARPEFLDVASAHSPAFPSGHATAAMAVYGFLAYVLVRMSTHVRRRFEVAYWAGVLIALVGFSRVYLRVHYATDVVGGFLVGAFWLLAGIVVARWVDCGERAENEGPV